MNKNRIEWIDRMRGLAIISVVIQHLSNNFSGSGSLTYLNLIGACNMGVFFFVSGYIINKTANITDIKSCLCFIRKKFIQLIIPLLFWDIISHYIFAKEVSFLSLEDLYYEWKKPHLWYLLTLFGYTIPLPFYKLILNNKNLSSKILIWLLCNCVFIIIWKLTGDFKNATMYLSSFAFGVLTSDYKKLEMNLNNKWFATISIIFILLFTNTFVSGSQSIYNSLIKIILTFSSIICLYQLCNIKWKQNIESYITKCGIYSIAIYAIHWYFTDLKFLVQYFNTNNELIIFLISSITAVIISLICIYTKIALQKYYIFDGLMFGGKWKIKKD